jgi:putative phosphoesterase
VSQTYRKIGLISDTHGLLRPEALHALRSSNLILHAGDVGKSEILDQLRGIAPVVAVRGNVDNGSWAMSLKETEIVETALARIYVLHNLQDLDLDPAAAGMHIVLSGHTHKPGSCEKEGVLYINPGSAGPRRFHLPICLASLDLSTTPWKVEFVELDTAI